MRAVIEGELYDTENATLVHETGFAGEGGYYRQTIWETSNGGWFYAYEYPHSPPKICSFEEPTDLYASWARQRGLPEEDGPAQVWLERHGAVDAILERWPERVMAG